MGTNSTMKGRDNRFFWNSPPAPTIFHLPMEKSKLIPPTKVRILEASFAAFNAKGFEAVSMDEVSRQLRISKKTIYKHFGSKEELLEAALVELFGRIDARLTALARQKLPKEMLLRYFDIFKTWKTSLTALLKAELRQDLPYLADRIENFERQTLLRHLIAYIKDWRDATIIDYPSPSREFAMTLFQMMEGMVAASEEHAEYFLMSLFKGMSVKKKKKKGK